MELELLATGFGLVEGPRTDAANNLYFTDATKGGVYVRSAAGDITALVPGRRMVGGLAVHADGGLVMSGPDVVHWRPGTEDRVLLRFDDVKHWNDLHTDRAGRVLVGSVRSDLSGSLKDAEKIPGECWRISGPGAAEELYGGIEVSNGIGFSPDGTVLYHSDSTTKGIWAHDVAADGSVSGRRHLGREAFQRGIPDGMCVDADGNLWVAHVGGGRAVKLSPSGEVLDEIKAPAKWVTSVAFGGPDWSDFYLVSSDNTDDPAKAGCIWRCRPGVAGVPTPLATV